MKTMSTGRYALPGCIQTSEIGYEANASQLDP